MNEYTKEQIKEAIVSEARNNHPVGLLIIALLREYNVDQDFINQMGEDFKCQDRVMDIVHSASPSTQIGERFTRIVHKSTVALAEVV